MNFITAQANGRFLIRLARAHIEETLFELGASVWCRPKTLGRENQ